MKRVIGSVLAVIAVIALVGAGAATGAPTRAVPLGMTLYSSPTHEAFVANADDEIRGDVSNPFGTHISREASGLANLDEKQGPFPGDEALFTFDVYGSGKLQASIGTATFTCQYYFDKSAFCDVSFQLVGGSLIAAGAFNFNSKTFALAITGGYGKYSGASGDIEASPSGKLAQRLEFTFS